MRIVAGKYGGRRLNVPQGQDIRPTSDKIRGAIFNALHARGAVEDTRVLDCFCGTGALGLEALSRGAASCKFWDKSRSSLELAKQNAGDLDALDDCAFEVRDATTFEAAYSGEKYDLVFLDPPYRKSLLPPVLQGLQGYGYLSNEAYCVVECEADYKVIADPAFTVQFEKIYGDTQVVLLSYSNND